MKTLDVPLQNGLTIREYLLEILTAAWIYGDEYHQPVGWRYMVEDGLVSAGLIRVNGGDEEWRRVRAEADTLIRAALRELLCPASPGPSS